MRFELTSTQLEVISEIIGNTEFGLTKEQIKRKLEVCQINIQDNGRKKSQYLYDCLANEVNNSKNFNKVTMFIEEVFNPINYTEYSNRDRYYWMLEEINKVLLLIGLQLGNNGKISVCVKADTLSEVDRRVNELNSKLYHRAIHQEVKKYCVKDYLRKDYYDAVFEASKGLAERVRNITGLTSDGGTLFQTAFSTKNPYLFFNSLETESEKNEFMGLKELLEAIMHLVRNPTAHTPKINWITNETKTLDILTLISFAHKYLDECYKVPRKGK